MADPAATNLPPISEKQYIEGKASTYDWFMGAFKAGIGVVVTILVLLAVFVL